jgi:RNA polymerase sigma-70 factor, ECF subfamily
LEIDVRFHETPARQSHLQKRHQSMGSAAMLEEVGFLQQAHTFSQNVAVAVSRVLSQPLKMAWATPPAPSAWMIWSMSASMSASMAPSTAPVGAPPGRVIDVSLLESQPRVPATADAVLKELMTEHLSAMYRVARAVVHDGALAEDVVQEALLKAWQAASTFRGEASLRSWALRITHNTGVSVLRRRREELRDPELLPETEHGAGTDRQVQGRMMVEELWKALDRLDPLSRTIVVLREIESMSYEDISSSLDISLPTVKTRLFRARRILATDLGGWSE